MAEKKTRLRTLTRFDGRSWISTNPGCLPPKRFACLNFYHSACLPYIKSFVISKQVLENVITRNLTWVPKIDEKKESTPESSTSRAISIPDSGDETESNGERSSESPTTPEEVLEECSNHDIQCYHNRLDPCKVSAMKFVDQVNAF